MSFNPEVVRQGNTTKKRAEETPNVFATEGGSSSSIGTGSFDKKNQTRMAGPGGAFAMQMMSDPELQARVKMWGQQFAQSNQGMQFNQAKMMLMGAGSNKSDKKPEATNKTTQQQNQPKGGKG